MKLKPKSERKKLRKPTYKVSCPFCWEYFPGAKRITNVFTAGGVLGGTCNKCGALYIYEETGRLGGTAVLDLQAMLADGDLDAALLLENGVDFHVKKRELSGVGRGRGPSSPQAWVMRPGPPEKKKPKKKLKIGSR